LKKLVKQSRKKLTSENFPDDVQLLSPSCESKKIRKDREFPIEGKKWPRPQPGICWRGILPRKIGKIEKQAANGDKSIFPPINDVKKKEKEKDN